MFKKKKNIDKSKAEKPDSEINKIIKPNPSVPKTHNYFYGHDCHLPPEKLSSYVITSKGISLWIFNFMAVHAGDIRAMNMYR